MDSLAIYIITIVVFLIVMFILRKFVKWAFRIVSLIFLISFVLSLVLGFFVYQDMKELSHGWPDSDKLVLLANDEVYAGMITTFGEGKEPVFVDDVDNYQTAYQDKDYQTILAANYKLFIFKLSMFERTDEELDFSGEKISKTEIINAIESGDSIDFIADELTENTGSKEEWKSEVMKEVGGDSKFKGMLFGVLLQNKMTKDPLFVFKQYSKGNVVIYPESITFKLIKALPFSLIEGVAEKVIGGVEERLGQ